MTENNKSPETILITGGLGFIGSAYTWHLNRRGEKEIILCDHFRNGEKWKNVRGLLFEDIISPETVVDYILGELPEQKHQPKLILHLGACSSTTEEDMDFLFRNNYEFSKQLWQAAVEKQIPFFYASSAATYGKGEHLHDFNSRKPLSSLRPLNKYGYSKQLFDLWVEKQIARKNTPPAYGGFKFFNVFGPHEYHKGTMASVVFHAYHQIKSDGKVKLFKSYHPNFPDGGQIRDFVYIKNICVNMYKIIFYILNPKNMNMDDPLSYSLDNPQKLFLHNLGSGKSHTFVDLVNPIFTALKLKPNIEFIEMPEHLRSNYQYFTQSEQILTIQSDLATAVKDYVQHLENEPYLSVTQDPDPYLD